ncbi:MAG: hypothetical protein D6680_18300 [Cyanobacteria bacterium J007]|nr:MAG: hypothetical protein D6680_18300 [Cyanobacteria bacterium J007]
MPKTRPSIADVPIKTIEGFCPVKSLPIPASVAPMAIAPSPAYRQAASSFYPLGLMPIAAIEVG